MYKTTTTNSYIIVLFRKITEVRNNPFCDSVSLILKPFLGLTKYLKAKELNIRNLYKK